MKKLLSLFIAINMVLSSVTVFAKENNSKNDIKETAKILTTAYGASSVQYALMDNGKITLSDSVGLLDEEKQIAPTKDTMYGIGSVSKIYTAAGIMFLSEQGKIDIDKPIINYLPEFKMKDERYKKITPRMLLNHSSGIYGTTFNNVMLFNDNSTDNHGSLLKNLSSQNLKYNPGEMSEYCNDGFTILEIIIEKIEGVTFTEFLETKLLKSLDLKNTKTPQSDFDRNRLAKSYLKSLYNGALPYDNANVIGSGGIYSTAEELCKFAEILIGNTDILSIETVEKMKTNQMVKGFYPDNSEDSFFNYGLGYDNVQVYPFNNYNIQAMFKGGDTIQYHAILVTIPEHNLSAAVVSAGGSSLFNYSIASKILEDKLLEKGIIKNIYEAPALIEVIKKDIPKEMNRYLGTYALAGGISYKIEFYDNELLMPVPSFLQGLAQKENFIYIGDEKFKSKDGKTIISFKENKEGIIFLSVNTVLQLPGLEEIPISFFDSQKIEKNNLEKEIADTWKEREGQKYFIVSDKPSSQMYFVTQLFMDINLDLENGYAYGGNKIIDKNFGKNVLWFRDTVDLEFLKKNDTEYLKARGVTFIGDKNITEIYSGQESFCTIKEDNYAVWFKIGDSSDKTMIVDVPKDASFTVYDSNFIPINSFVVSNINETILPKNGFIVFNGINGQRFNISLK